MSHFLSGFGLLIYHSTLMPHRTCACMLQKMKRWLWDVKILFEIHTFGYFINRLKPTSILLPQNTKRASKKRTGQFNTYDDVHVSREDDEVLVQTPRDSTDPFFMDVSFWLGCCVCVCVCVCVVKVVPFCFSGSKYG